MSIRALWIISHEKGESGKVRFSRRYPTVESRASRLGRGSYVPVPEDSALLRPLLTDLGLTDPEKPFVEARDGCSRLHRTAALELVLEGRQGAGAALWPVLAIPQGGLILACLPLVEAPPGPRPPLPSLASVSQGFSLLAGLQAFLSGSGAGKAEVESRLALLPAALMQACPLGTPLETPQLCQPLPPPTVSLAGSQKQPAWKPGVHRGRALVSVAVSEQVRSMQYGNRARTDLWDVYGTVTCKCDLEGVLPTVTVTLSLPPNGSPLQDILAHPCISSLDSSLLTASSVDESDGSAFSGPYKFPFSPPLEPFHLCFYTSQVPVPPILGSYQLREEGSQLKITVNLKLHESVRNGFEYCEAHLPFFNRGQFTNTDLRVTSGQLEVAREKSLLVWVLGQKFPKSREVSLGGSVSFSGAGSLGPVDPLCTELTAYIKLYFRIPDVTLSGCSVDQHSVQVYSSVKPRITTSRELISSEYYIWNSTGEAPVSSGPMRL
ncbi:AP-5 complex subunit mu-1-like isoform X1 [Acipenser oxyrinchus oxyrinchus]|uniref:AP-5 complex subunit mu-1 n=1 Tax=Acipenser oxyrinchus oxyrinchus TaxID=40147 RepID=A0AAD8G1E2_ACIOX|nr:AP-5 complex subunit mu-1-like isoform X1 [Acipenser oxyrinchus oxyrinchus]KAK1160654.1 AP-5 complex subunit mu-1-like isoform X1 [Acipenser oxyrinchus oxyrinchus]